MNAVLRLVLRRQLDEQEHRLEQTDHVIDVMRATRSESLRHGYRRAGSRLSHR